MTLCPVALAVGCRRCPVFAVCPLKAVIGDQAPAARAADKPAATGKKAKPRKRKTS